MYLLYFKTIKGAVVPTLFFLRYSYMLPLSVALSAYHSFSLLLGLQSAFYMGYHTIPINFAHSGLFRVIKVGERMINGMMLEEKWKGSVSLRENVRCGYWWAARGGYTVSEVLHLCFSL